MKINIFDDNKIREAFSIFRQQQEDDYLEEVELLKKQRSYEDDDEVSFWRSIQDAK